MSRSVQKVGFIHNSIIFCRSLSRKIFASVSCITTFKNRLQSIGDYLLAYHRDMSLKSLP